MIKSLNIDCFKSPRPSVNFVKFRKKMKNLLSGFWNYCENIQVINYFWLIIIIIYFWFQCFPTKFLIWRELWITIERNVLPVESWNLPVEQFIITFGFVLCVDPKNFKIWKRNYHANEWQFFNVLIVFTECFWFLDWNFNIVSFPKKYASGQQQ